MAMIMIVGGQPITVIGLVTLIGSGFPDCRIIGPVAAGLLADIRCDLLINVHGGRDDIAPHIWQSASVPVLHLTCGRQGVWAVGALFAAGARGVVDISNKACVVVSAIREVLDGGTFMEQSFKEQLLGPGEVPGGNLAAHGLSGREREIALMMLDGKKMCEIGRCLGLKASTITTFKTRIYRKLGVDDVLALRKAYGAGS